MLHKYGRNPLVAVGVRTIFIKSLYIKLDLPTHKRVVSIDIFYHPLSIIWSFEAKLNFTQRARVGLEQVKGEIKDMSSIFDDYTRLSRE